AAASSTVFAAVRGAVDVALGAVAVEAESAPPASGPVPANTPSGNSKHKPSVVAATLNLGDITAAAVIGTNFARGLASRIPRATVGAEVELYVDCTRVSTAKDNIALRYVSIAIRIAI